MSARKGVPGETPPSRLAAELYLRGGTTLKAVAAQYGLAYQTVHEVATRIREEGHGRRSTSDRFRPRGAG